MCVQNIDTNMYRDFPECDECYDDTFHRCGRDGVNGRDGRDGHSGKQGEQGPMGHDGPRGPTGSTGYTGPIGRTGLRGPTGIQGATGNQGPTGNQGATGIAGSNGQTGPVGQHSYADFYALIPGDDLATVAVGADVEFPNDGPSGGTDILRLSTSSFTLVSVGTYQVMFQVSINEPGQLIVTLNNVPQPYTTVGRATGTCQIVGICLVTTVDRNTTVTIRNPVGNTTALTITPLAGGATPVSAHVCIVRVD